MFIIGCINDDTLYWSNETGWVDLDSADRFNDKERRSLNLPMEGYWIPLWSVDCIQFARFIAECEANGVFSGQAMNSVAESMDLELSQVISIIDRAQNRWDEWSNPL